MNFAVRGASSIMDAGTGACDITAADTVVTVMKAASGGDKTMRGGAVLCRCLSCQAVTPLDGLTFPGREWVKGQHSWVGSLETGSSGPPHCTEKRLFYTEAFDRPNITPPPPRAETYRK